MKMDKIKKNEENVFGDIIGYDDIKLELKMILDIICNCKKYEKLGVKRPKGVLLYGNPGVGKTLMANSFVKATERKVFICRKKKPDGEFVNEIAEIFESAKKSIPAIVFLDDMDKYANEDEEHLNAEEFVALQTCIDDVKDMDVFIIATANDLTNIPDSLLRAGRFDKTIRVDNPEGDDAVEIVAHYLRKKNISTQIDAKEIAEILTGKSCADLEMVINEAGIYAGYDNRDCIDMQDILKACLRIIYHAPAKSKPDADIKKVSYHEAGHALISELLDPGSVALVTVQGNHSKYGGVNKLKIPDGYWYSKKKMENRVMVLLAGKAATEIIYGEVDVGADNDLTRAFSIVERFVDDYCSSGFDCRIERKTTSDELLARRELKISSEIERFYENVKELLFENKEILDRVANELMESKTITGTMLRKTIAIP